MQDVPYLAFAAGPLRVALPLFAVRQILDAGDANIQAQTSEPALPALNLARLLGEDALTSRPAVVIFESGGVAVRLACCRLLGVFHAATVTALPPAVLVRWPGLVKGLLRYDGLIMLVDPMILRALIDDDPGVRVAIHGPAA